MSATKNREKDESVLAESDNFQYEAVSPEDGWSLTEGEEDLEATVKAIQDRAEASAAEPSASITHPPEAVDDFLRNFLSQMGMIETLDCFQTEWTEMVQKGLVDPGQIGVVPDVYSENQHLDSELKNAHREREEYRLAVSTGAETLLRVQKDRDYHRLQHKRVVQEKNRLIEEMRKLKMQCNSHEPALKRMNEKYQAVLKQTMLVTLQRDKVLGQSAQLSIPLCKDACEKEAVDSAGVPSVKMTTTHQVIQPGPPTAANIPRSQSRVKSVKASVCEE